MWLSKDKNGRVHLSMNKPWRFPRITTWSLGNPGSYLLIPKSEWKKYGCENLKWEDEPVEVRIII
jgi:hypothetical protein